MQAQNESHDQKLNELVLIKEKEKEAQETNFTTIKSTMIEDFNKKLQTQTELHDSQLVELGQLKDREKVVLETNFEQIKSSMVDDHNK